MDPYILSIDVSFHFAIKFPHSKFGTVIIYFMNSRCMKLTKYYSSFSLLDPEGKRWIIRALSWGVLNGIRSM